MPPAHPPQKPADLLNLRGAAALVGRSADTVRRWRTTYGLRDYRDPDDLTAPSCFSRSELLAVQAKANARRPGTAGDYIDGVSADPAGPLPAVLPTRPAAGGASGGASLALVQMFVDDLRASRERLQVEAEAERARANAAVDALDVARQQTIDLAVRLERLETLVLSGRAAALEAERAKLAERRGVQAKPRKAKRKR